METVTELTPPRRQLPTPTHLFLRIRTTEETEPVAIIAATEEIIGIAIVRITGTERITGRITKIIAGKTVGRIGRTTVIITGRATETIARNKGRELITISNPTMTSLRIMTNLSNRSNRPDLIKRRIGQRQSLRLKKFIAACVTCFLCFSCENEAVYDQYQAIQNTSWEKNKEYYFTFLIEDISVPYDLTLEVRNNNMYPYQNLWVFCSEELPIGPLKRDTIECMLADEFGKWYGDGISLFQSSFPIRSAYYFPVKGQYTFSFRQGMRNDQLPGIQEIGLRVLPSSTNAPSEKRPNEEK